jgi:hypothetical protein
MHLQHHIPPPQRSRTLVQGSQLTFGISLPILALSLLLSGCGSDGGGSDTSSTVTVAGDVPIAYAMRSTRVGMNPTDGTNSAPGGDLMLRDKASPSAPEHNLTRRITLGLGDVSDPEVSYDGQRIVFSLRCPASNAVTIDQGNGPVPACTGRWNLWEYDRTGTALNAGVLRRLTASTSDDDVDPVYLPASQGVVFASNRQHKSRINQALGRSYAALDEYERERVLNLHRIDANGGDLQQISFNQSHERNPVIRPNGDIMFSRWEHVGDRNRFAIFRSKPDGTDMFVLYGAQSPGNSFLHPRDMDPAGPYAGFLATSLMALSGTQEGGKLMFVDAANYSEANTPATPSIPAQGGQREATARRLNDGRGLSDFGRVTTPYPLWDGSNRVLLSYRPCEVTRNGVVVSCTTLTEEERALLADDERPMAARAQDSVRDNAPSTYAVYMFDPAQDTWLIVAAPPPGFMYTDPVALQARPEPNATQPTTIDPDLAAQNLALIEVRSVYDTDGLQRMGERMTVAADGDGPGCGTRIPMTTPHDVLDTRAQVADLLRMKDPADPAYHCAPARFVRAVRAVAPPSGGTGLRNTIGETDFEQQQILGYAPVEPDGSFKLQIPADVPLALSIIDSQGRSFQTHTNWIQVRPGERRTCDGCHSPRRGGALNSGPIVNALPTALRAALTSQHLSGETLASLRTRLDPSALRLAADPVFTDIWADTTQPTISARAPITLRYTGNPNPLNDLATQAPVNGVINYPEHIQPLWDRARGPQGTHSCINCHAGTSVGNNGAPALDLRATVAGSGRLTSYESLLIGAPVIDPVTGLAQTRMRQGVPELLRQPPLVESSSGAANTAGQSRKSRLTEILWGQTLLAGNAAASTYPLPTASATVPDHATLLNAAEKRLVAEWMDLGGQYYNDPFHPDGGVRSITGLSETAFVASVQPVLAAQCMACHGPGASSPTATVDTPLRGNRLVLTGSEEGDYNVVLTLINDACNAAANPLLARPATVPHPAGALTQTTPVLPAGSAGYNAIAAWINTGCPSR